MGMGKKALVAIWAAGFVASVGLGACGGTPPPAQPPQASAEVSGLRIALKSEAKGEAAIQTAVEASLARAGLQVVGEKDGDVIATLRVQKTEKSGIFKVVRNGQPVVNYAYVVTLQLTGGGGVIDVGTVEFTGEANEVDNDKVTELVRAVAGSEKLKRFALQLEGQRKRAASDAKQAEADQKAKDAAVEKEAKQKAEALAWVEADAPACRDALGPDACKKLDVYLAKFPDAVHAAEAKSILNGAAEKIDKLRADDAAWKTSGAAACVPGSSVDDCEGVEIYLVKYPAGLHADEARNALKRAKGKGGDESSATAATLAQHLAFLKKVKAKAGPYFQRGQKAIRESRKRMGHSTNLQFKRQQVVIACLTGKWVYTLHEYSWRNQRNYPVDGVDEVVHLEDGTSSVNSGLLPHHAQLEDVQAKRLDRICAEVKP